MNVEKITETTLINANKDYHESYACPTCENGSKIKNAIWTSRENMKELTCAGLAQYYKDENVMMIPYSHALVMGSTGTGKTEVFYKNQLKLFAELPDDVKPSVEITDVKGEMYDWAAPYLEAHGYETRVFDMRRAYRTARYNFLTIIYDEYEAAEKIRKALEKNTVGCTFDGEKYDSVEAARMAAEAKMSIHLDNAERYITEIAYIIVPFQPEAKELTWSDGARTMLKAILWTMLKRSGDKKNRVTRNKFTIANVCRVAFSTGDECETIISWLSKAEDILCVKNAISGNYNIRAKVTRDGFISTLNTALSNYSSRAIGALTQTSDELNLKTIANGKKPYAIFVITDDRQKTTNDICLLFINNLINELINEADKSPTHALSRDFVILADEFANMPPLPNVTNKITTLRSRRIWMVMAIQSIQQLDAAYGKGESEIIQDNCDTHIFLGCNNDETKVKFANAMGTRIGVKTSISISNDGAVSISKITENVPVVRKSDMDNLELGEFYVRSRTSKNFKTYMTPHFRQTESQRLKPEEPPFRSYDPSKDVYDIFKVVEDETPKSKPYGWDF